MNLKQQLKANLFSSNKIRLNARKTEFLESSNPELFESILRETLFLPKESILNERIHCIINEIDNFPKCPICNKKKSFTIYRGYSKTCGSHRCAAILRNINKLLLKINEQKPYE